MEQGSPRSDITYPASIYRVFKHHREYPALPEGYSWETQKQLYCPRDLLSESSPGPLKLAHKFGYVFCHRGLYERASGIVDNSSAAITNGTSQGLFLHEVDAFVLSKMDEAFVAHDKNPRRVTSKTEPWEVYPYDKIRKSHLVTRRVDTEAPDFASSYLNTHGKVPGLLDTLLKEKLEPVGRTLQIDLRDEDFARAIPYYSFHISKKPFQHRGRLGAHHTMIWGLFNSTILKGYNMHFKSFDHLHSAIREKSEEAYRWNYFEVRHLHVLPPLIMVFYAGPVVDLAKETTPVAPLDPRSDRRSYEHIRRTFMNQVMSFVGVGEDSYNFILEIVHSGLGLGYDVKTGKATNPLNGEPLTNEDVVFESRVDRAMIDVSLELREKHPELLFSSCTRLPDVITPKGKFKASFATSRLVPVKDGEEGLSTKLRAIHGGLYPQSHLVVADDPAAEIAARTWIDEESGLDRSLLLRMPYDEWLAGAATDVVAAITELNDREFLPNRFGEPVPEPDTLGALGGGSLTLGSPVDSDTKLSSWFKDLLPPHNTPNYDVSTRHSDHQKKQVEDSGDSEYETAHSHESATLDHDLYQAAGQKSQSEDNGDSEGEAAHSDESGTLDHDLYHAADKSAWKRYERSQSGSDISNEPVTLSVGGRHTFLSRADAKRAVANAAAYKAAERGDQEMLRRLVSRGANINSSSYNSTPLAAACEKGHGAVVQWLMDAGADVNKGGVYGSPLELASDYGHVEIVEMLLTAFIGKNAYHINSGKIFSGTALHNASAKGHEAVVQLLLDRGADVDITGGKFHTALQAACSREDNMNIINMLLNANADIDAYGGVYGTALYAACACGHHDAVKALLEKGAVIDFLLQRGWKPEITSLLVNTGADLNSHAAPLPSTGLGSGARPGATFSSPGPDSGALLGACREEAGHGELRPDEDRWSRKGWAWDTELVDFARPPPRMCREVWPHKVSWKFGPSRERNRDEERRKIKRLIKESRAKPIRKPRKLPNCGCLVCYVDQTIQPAIPRYRPTSVVAVSDPVSHTLKLMRNDAAGS